MPAETVDDLFAMLRIQADWVPSGTAAEARQRAARRSRIRTISIAASAVCLISAGATTTLSVASHGSPAVLADTSRVAPVGSALSFGADAQKAVSAVTGDSVFTAWRATDERVGVLGADLRTGKRRWRVASLGSFNELRGVIALPGAVLVIVGRSTRDKIELTAMVLDPATGEKRWQFPYRVADDLIYYDDVLIQQLAATGETIAYDWSTGTVRWELPATADRPDRTLGMYVAADAQRIGRFGIPLTFIDHRLVQVMRSGAVHIRDAGSGRLTQTRTAGAGSDYPPFAYDGRLYSVEQTSGDSHYHLRVTALTGPPDSTIVHTGSLLGAFAPCDQDRVCVTDGTGDGGSQLTAIDVTDGRPAWRVATVGGAQSILALGAGILVEGPGGQALYSADGKQLAAAPNGLGRIDSDSLLMLPAAGKNLVRIAASSGAQQPLGPMPRTTFDCTWTADRLVCPGRSAVRIWSLPR
jgi:outer membrane protein assembly factor BamB